MATVIICRRLPRGVSRAATFSTVSRSGAKRTIPRRKSEEDGNPQVTDTKAEVRLRLQNPVEYRIFYNPSAYTATKTISYQNAAGSNADGDERPSASKFSSIVTKQVQNTYSITWHPSLSTKNTTLHLEFSKPFSTQASPKQPVKPKPKRDEMPDVEVEAYNSEVEAYNSKVDNRAFQKERPEYSCLCYDNSTPVEPLPLEERDLILHSISTLKSELVPGTIVEYFCKLSCLPVEQHAPLKSHIQFTMLCHYSVKKIQMFSTLELIAILKALVRLTVDFNHVMMSAYEREFCYRAWTMSLEQLLLVADFWRYLQCNVPHYLRVVLSFMSMHWGSLTLPQLVQLMYIIGEHRKAPPGLMQKLETLVLVNLDSFTLEEVGTVCLGAFKARHCFSEQVMQGIGDKISPRLEDMGNFALVGVLKMFRYSHVDHVNFMKRLAVVVPPRIHSIGIQGVMHISLFCAALRYLSKRIMNAVASSVPSRVTYCRYKDVAKFLWSFGTLNYEPPNTEIFYNSLIEQVRRQLHQSRKFPEHFLTCLLALAFTERYPYDLINYALSNEFIQLTNEAKFDLRKDLFTLDGSVEIECPDYKGNRLMPQLRQEATKILLSFAERKIYIKPEVQEALAVLEDILGGPEYVKNHMILPHTRTNDLEVHLDQDRMPVPFNFKSSPADKQVVKDEQKHIGKSHSDDLMNRLLNWKSSDRSSKIDDKTEVQTHGQKRARDERAPSPGDDFAFPDGVPLTDSFVKVLTKSATSPEHPPSPPRPQPASMKLAIQIVSRNHYCYKTTQLLGMHSMKRRQLQRLGYVVVELQYWEWFRLLQETWAKKVNYLRHKVFDSIPQK
ncbi:FAST kinase domain-containing protein 5, mitochondrial [Alligator sinensis]|uniref:FAST kinase domain-containing protein 5, mitochondrial n=1 Tax=Alligator sinensis TaxID=38654 RepID=A0A1U7RXT8_ALLSI|nr:FAST kinase domain-containing protein 5, mitochondrial [Alligator sinensis]